MIDALAGWFGAGLTDALLVGRAVLCALVLIAAAKLLIEGLKVAAGWAAGVWRGT